jgi:PAP2 superfamily
VKQRSHRSDLTRRELLRRAAGAAVGVGVAGAGSILAEPASARAFPHAAGYSAEIPTAWFDVALDLARTTQGFTPPVASRAFGYAGVALHESLVPGLRKQRTLVGRVNGLRRDDAPKDRAYHWPTVANSALAGILRLLFPNTPSTNVAGMDALEQRFASRARAVLPRRIFHRSTLRGAEVAQHVFDWSKTDGGHEAFLRNFPAYTPPTGPGLWVPTPPGFLPALQPFWGENRPFVLRAARLRVPGPPRYSERRGSRFHAEAAECYRVTSRLSQEQEAIARFWSDDPGETATPPGHSVSILTQVLRAQDASLSRAAEAYAKVGIAVADAFIACWRTKYDYNLIRPVTYIQRVIDPSWTPLLTTPPFPEYTSGHSVQSGAAAQVLTDLFGQVAFTDHTHDRLGLPARSFRSFTEAAEEAALSRLYGGIHFRAAIEHGLEQGRRVGERVSAIC